MLDTTEKTTTNEDRAPTVDVGEANFAAAVLQSEQPVLVAFWAPWSRPCQVLDPVLQELARALVGRAKVVKVNADDCLDLSLHYDIQSIPTLLCFVEGKPRLQIVGTATKPAILSKLTALGVLNETVPLPKGTSGAGRQPAKEKRKNE